MTRKDIITQLRNAKLAHTTWKSYAHLIAKGVIEENSDKMSPLVPTACEFGQWYYKEGAILSRMKKYQELEEAHNKVHDIYADIFKLSRERIETGFFQSKKNAEAQRDEKVEAKLRAMDSYVTILINTLTQLEDEVSNMSDMDLMNLAN